MGKTADIKIEYRAHPLMILTYLKPYMFVLIIPTVQGLITYLLNRRITNLIIGECVTAAVILAISVFKYLRCRMILCEDSITVREGFLVRSTSVIPVNKISSSFIRTGVILRIFGAIEVRLNTEAGKPGKSDFRMIMPRSAKSKLYKLFPRRSGDSVKYEPTAKRLIIMAAATSNSATGLLIAAPVINHAGKLLGAGFTQQLYDKINVAVELAESKVGNIIPPIAGAIAIVFLIGYGASFIMSVFKNLPFKMHRNGDRITATAGTLTKRRISFRVSRVNSVTVSQNPVMMLFKRYNVGVNVAGYGDAKGETAMIIPAAQSEQVYDLASRFFKNIRHSAPEFGHSSDTLRRFCTPPAVLMAAVPVAATILSKIFPYFSDFIWFLAFVCELFDLLFFMVQVRAYQRGGVSFGDECCALAMKWFGIRELHCPKEKVGVIRVTQYPWEKKPGLCRVKITVRSESSESLNIPHLKYNDITDTLNRMYESGVKKSR